MESESVRSGQQQSGSKRGFAALWITLIVVALVLRLAQLNIQPLSPEEASIALPSLDAIRGNGWPTTTESPLLLMGNALIFLLLGPSHATARLLPVLFGIMLVSLPWLWRRRLGEREALVAAALLAFSPVALFAARHLDASVVGALGAALVMTALSTAPRRPALVLGVGLTLGLTGGPVFYDTLLPGLVAWGLTLRFFSDEPRLGRDQLLRGTLMGLGGAALISVGFGLRWTGWAGPAAGFAAWLQGWWSGSGAGSLNLSHLLLYEPLTLLLAGVGLYLGARNPDRLSLHMGAWTVLGAALTLLRSDTGPVALIAILFPLVLLAGKLVILLISSLKQTWHVYLHAFLVLLFWSFAGLVLIRQTSYLQSGMEFVLVLLVFLIQGLLIAGFATLIRPALAWRSLLIGTSIVLLILQFGFAWRANFNAAAAPHEPLVTSLASRDLHNLRETVEMLRIAEQVSPENLEIVLVDADPAITNVIRWALRDWPGLRVSSTWPAASTDLVITPAEITPPTGMATTFQGMAFTAALQADDIIPNCTQLVPPICPGAINWYLYRKSPVPVQKARVILWATGMSDQP
jgi:hypothetical protein